MSQAVDPTPPRGGLTFGTFELDLESGELRKGGRKVRLQDQPFRVLAALVAKRGEVVTREELKQKLWPADTYVDFDRSLNTAASKLRDALGDSASSPRFIETLPRRGYRFLAPVQGLMPAPAVPSAPAAAATAARELRKQVRRARITAVAATAALVATAALWLSQSPEPRSPLRKLSLNLPGYAQAGPTISGAAISPNAKHIAYASTDERKIAVWDLGLGSHRVIEGTERAFRPFWSPDSRSIGFWTETGEIKRVGVDGGPVTVIGEAVGCCAFGTWSPDGETIVYDHGARLFELPARGGKPREIGASGEWKRGPSFLPTRNARLLLFVVRSDDALGLRLLDVDTGSEMPLADLERGHNAEVTYSPSGHLVYSSGSGIVWAVPFSLKEREVTGQAFPIAQDAGGPSIASDGTLLYNDSSQARFRFVWVNRSGAKLADATRPLQRLGYFSLSPDDRFVAVSGSPPSLHDLSRLITTSLGSRGSTGVPSWSTQGEEVLFSSEPPEHEIYLETIDGSRKTQHVFTPEDGDAFVTDWSRDRKLMFFDKRGRDIWYLEADGEGGYEAKSFLTSEFTEKAAVISPDNRLVAYVSDESGKLDVYVRSFPNGEREKISIDGGRAVRWGGDGRRVYYTSGTTLFETDVRFERGELVVGVPQALFEWPGLGDGANVSAYQRYGVSSDSERFIVVETLPEGQRRIQLVQSWYEEFRNRQVR